MFATLILSLTMVSVHAFTAHRPLWSYHGDTGPEDWSSLEGSHCGSHSQSPVDIITANTPKRCGHLKLSGYSLQERQAGIPIEIVNNGHSVQVNLIGDYLMAGGGLSAEYKAVQFHFHWGSENNIGSEHAVNGEKYPAEMHIVHYDYIKYKDLSEAVVSEKPGAVAVVAVFIKVGGKDNPHFGEVVQSLPNVAYEGQVSHIEPFDLANLLPSDLGRFYRYEGSLTTPNCDPDVTWTIMQEAVSISQTQLDAFRSLYSTREGDTPEEQLVNNFRPLQPLKGRTVYLYSPGTSVNKLNRL